MPGRPGSRPGITCSAWSPSSVILDGNRSVGDNWRQQWDSPSAESTGEDLRAAGDPVPGQAVARIRARTRSADFLASYAVAVAAACAALVGEGPFARQGGDGLSGDDGPRTSTATTSSSPRYVRAEPGVPDFAATNSTSTLQLHSNEYRRPDQVTDGPVSVVGAAHPAPTSRTRSLETHPRCLRPRLLVDSARPGSPALRLAFPFVFRLAARPHTAHPDATKITPESASTAPRCSRVKRATWTAEASSASTSRGRGVAQGRPESPMARPATPPPSSGAPASASLRLDPPPDPAARTAGREGGARRRPLRPGPVLLRPGLPRPF